jgi:hypothetical protein
MKRVRIENVVGEVVDSDSLHAAMRQRAIDLQLVLSATTRGKRSIDDLAGLPAGYTSKTLAPKPIKRLDRISLGPTMAVLGVKLLLVEDTEAMEAYTKHLERHPHTNGSGYANHKMPTRKYRRKHRFPKDPEFARLMRARGILKSSPKQRRKAAQKAARVRWRKPRVVEITPSDASAIPSTDAPLERGASQSQPAPSSAGQAGGTRRRGGQPQTG